MKPLSQQQQWAKVQYSVTRLGGGQTQQGVSFPGGLDLTTPSLALQPGALTACQNFECSQSGGYGRIGGYERYDGHASPSAALYTIVQFTAFTTIPAVNDALKQATSNATGTVIAVVTAPTPYVALTQVSGVFDTAHTVTDTTQAGATVGIPVPTMVGIDSKTNAIYIAAAADVYRALIGPVPGSGSILGVVGMTFNNVDNVYGFRANSGGTAVAIYKASSLGWVLVPFYNLVSFVSVPPGDVITPDMPGQIIPSWETEAFTPSLTVENSGGLTVQGQIQIVAAAPQPQDGDILTQGGVTATIKRVMWQSGSFSSSAAGQFVITNPAGGDFTQGLAATSSGIIVTLSGIQTPISLKPGGRFEFVTCNFSGSITTRRIYGCDGVNQCFEFDGDVLAPISTGLSPDAPSHIAFHRNYLFVSESASISFCGAGTPFKWNAIDGGGEIATGDIVTAMLTLPGSQTSPTLAVYQRTNTSFLYGSDPTTFSFVTFNTGLGALPYSAQNLFDTFFFDPLGVVTLRTTLNWGNFLPSSLTKNLLPLILQERTKLSASAILRSKSQYRVFFSDGAALFVTMVNQQYLGTAQMLLPNPVFVCDETVTANGTEVSYFGSNDGLGYVYQMDVGTSFDGADIGAFITLAWDAIKSPEILKRFRAVSMEMQGSSFASVTFGYQLGYGSSSISQPNNVTRDSGFVGSNWDSFTWDNFVWDGQTLIPTRLDMTGTGENIQVTISSGTNYIGAFNVNSLIYHFSMRRGLRV